MKKSTCTRLLFLISAFCLLLNGLAVAQQKIRKFPPSINHPSLDIYAPFISLDGSSLLYTSPYGLEREQLIYYSQRARGDWKAPAELPRHLNNGLNLEKAYTLSPDGSTLYITSIKSGGVGGFDIWYSNRTGNSWSQIMNIYAPINSKLHEGSPTFTPDGKTIFFMRCEKMTQQKAENCKIFYSKKDFSGRWKEPVELPDYINTGNSQLPRIMGDGETLFFSSDKITPNKGGKDLYVTKLKDGVWSKPIPLDFVNTADDDQYACAVATGRYLIRDSQGERKREIVEYLIPDDLRPKGVMKIEGKITDGANAPTPAYISIIDLTNNKRVYNAQPEKDGSFFTYLNDGSRYEISIDPEQGNYTYFAKQYDLTGEDMPMIDRIDVTLKPLAAGDELPLDGITFKPNSYQMQDATSEMRRLARLLKSTNLNYEIQVLLAGYVEDSVQSTPDLTEVLVDTILIKKDSIDSLGQVFTYDSVTTKTTYHNNRTERQAKEVINQLVMQGIDSTRLSYFYNARPEAILENRKTSVRLVARTKK